MDINAFTENQRPIGKRHRLYIWRSEIDGLLQLNYSQAQILEFLHQNNVTSSIDSLGYFIRKHIKRSMIEGATTVKNDKKSNLNNSIDTSSKATIVKNSTRALDEALNQQINMDHFI